MDPRLANAKDQSYELAADLLGCLRFCTRLPIPVYPFEKAPERPISLCARMLPIAGAIIGAIAAIVLWIAARLGLPPALAALIAVSSLVILTGGLHEDGLADYADATAGATAEQRLAIMKDSRIGAFGALALALTVLARVLSLAMIAADSLPAAMLVLIAVAAISRTLMLLALHLPPARSEGSGFAAAGPPEPVSAVAALMAFLLGLLPLLAGAGIIRVLLAMILAIAAAYWVVRLARRLFEGQTGDVAGATQQAAEIAAYLVYASTL
ncbi:MAG TPA: adenosylcobinamide-GDP ribazoletransferase [Methylovirgula sp.]|nr:adenosylcobinamide-GDP ribazoletransferase [Methylovirgula sp.]